MVLRLDKSLDNIPPHTESYPGVVVGEWLQSPHTLSPGVSAHTHVHIYTALRSHHLTGVDDNFQS